MDVGHVGLDIFFNSGCNILAHRTNYLDFLLIVNERLIYIGFDKIMIQDVRLKIILCTTVVSRY